MKMEANKLTVRVRPRVHNMDMTVVGELNCDEVDMFSRSYIVGRTMSKEKPSNWFWYETPNIEELTPNSLKGAFAVSLECIAYDHRLCCRSHYCKTAIAMALNVKSYFERNIVINGFIDALPIAYNMPRFDPVLLSFHRCNRDLLQPHASASGASSSLKA